MLVAVLAVALLAAMVASTKFLTPQQVTALNPPAFTASGYVAQHFPEVTKTLTDKATDIATVAPAIDAGPAAAGKKYGTAVGGDQYAFAVKATGTVTSVDSDFVILKVPGVPAKDTVRIPLGIALNGTPVRDAPGTIAYGDFPDQTAYQSVANLFTERMRQQVLAPAKLPAAKGRSVTVVGAYETGGPPNSYIIQPVSISVGR